MTKRRVFGWAAVSFAVVLSVLLAAPLWAPVLGLGPPAPPARGREVALPGGARVNVIDEGAGPAVVLIHGLPGTAYDWQPLPERLVAAGHRVIRYDRIGYGYSDRRTRDEDHSLDAKADELLELLAELRVESPVWLGWSYGGGVVLRAAEKSAGRPRAVMLVGSIGPVSRAEEADRVLVATESLQRWGLRSGFLARPGMGQMGRLAFSGSPPDWWASHMIATLALPGAVHSWAMETKYLDASALHPEAVTVPAVVVHGTADNLVPLAVGEDLAARIPKADLVEVADGSHMLPITHAELLVERLERRR